MPSDLTPPPNAALSATITNVGVVILGGHSVHHHYPPDGPCPDQHETTDPDPVSLAGAASQPTNGLPRQGWPVPGLPDLGLVEPGDARSPSGR
jgi:hypothetical protein